MDADILDADGHHVYNYTDNVTFGVGYPNILFTYMICVACADTYNEKGISLIKKLRNEYFDFAPLRKEGKVETFAETIK